MAKVDNTHTTTLIGTGGADILDGTATGIGQQHDELFGLQGDDLFRIDWFSGQTDAVIENANGGTDTIELYVSQSGPANYVLADNIENLRVSGIASVFAIGNDLANVIDDDGNSHGISGGGGDDTINGNGGGDTLYGGAGKDLLNAGPAGDDGHSTLFGDDEVLSGNLQGGNDTLNGNSFVDNNGNAVGGDQLIGDGAQLSAGMVGGDDLLNGGAGTDQLIGDAFDIEYGGRGGNDILNGDPANATAVSQQLVDDALYGDASGHLYGRGGNDTLNGGKGNDHLYGDAGGFMNGGFGGNDILNGGTGNDFLVGDGGKLETVFRQDGSNFGGVGGNDTLNGDAGNDRLFGDVSSYLWDRAIGGNDTLNGGDGDDFLSGDGMQLYTSGSRGGDDKLDGGAGNDVLYGDAVQVEGHAGADKLSGGDGNDLLYGDGAYGSGLDAGGNDILDGGNGNDWLYGNGGDDNLIGGAGNDRLYGGAGNDRLEGGAGDDQYVNVEAGDQPVIEAANGGNDTVYASARSYTLAANVENLVLLDTQAPPRLGVGNALANHLTGSGSQDRLQGLDGDDTLDGGAGSDTLEGGAGNDVYVVDSTGDVVIEGVGAGTDTVFASMAAYVLGPNVENLSFTVGIGLNPQPVFGRGNALNNVIVTNDNNDTLVGDGGDDTLRGGRGADLMIGGAGNDTYFVDQQLTSAFDDVVEKINDGIDLVRVSGPIDNFTSGTFYLAPNVENLIAEVNAGAASLTLVGNALANTIDGNEAANTLIGGAGNDTLRGGLGDDTYLVQDVGDSVSENANAGNDTVRLFVAPATVVGFSLGANIENLVMAGLNALNATGNGLDNLLTGNGGANRLDGGAGNDHLLGGRDNDVLLGGDGNDTLDGGTGNDSMTGGAGNDTYSVDSAQDSVSEVSGGGIDTIVSQVSFDMSSDGPDGDAVADGLNVENLTLQGYARFGTGNALDNILIGNGRANVLVGLAGNDVLDGGAGIDRLDGGAGNDTYLVDDTNDVVVEGVNGGADLVISTAPNFTLSDQVDNLTLGKDGGNGTGNGLANVMLGNDNANMLRGLDGDDKLSGAGGDDHLYGSAGADTVNGDAGNDRLYGDLDADTLRGGTGNDNVDGGGGDDRLYGDAGNDFMTGDVTDAVLQTTAGNDRLDGGDGDDWLFGDSDQALMVRGGNDTLFGGAGADVLIGDGSTFFSGGSGGNDVLNGGDGNDILYGDVYNRDALGGGDDTLNGDAGDDTLYGGTGNDKLNGGTGNDWLYGNAGNDTMAGGDGDDTYYVDASGDKVVEANTAGAGSADTVVTTIDFDLGTSAANVENVTGNQQGNGLHLKGSTGNNVLTLYADAQSGAATLEGLAGDDRYVFQTLMDGATATDTAGNDSLVASIVDGVDTQPFFTGIEAVTFQFQGGTSFIDGRSISVDAQHTQITDTSGTSLTLQGSASAALSSMRTFTGGITLRELSGSLSYSTANVGNVRFALGHVDLNLTVGANVNRVLLDVTGDGLANVMSASGIGAPITVLGTGGILHINSINFDNAPLLLQDYQGSLGIEVSNGTNSTASIETRGAHVALETDSALAHLNLTATGAASTLNMAQANYSDVTLLQTSTAAVTLTRLHQDVTAAQFAQSLTALFDTGGHTITTGTGDTRIVFGAGDDRADYLTNQFGAGDSVSDQSANDVDSLFVSYNAIGSSAARIELHTSAIENITISSTSGASFLSLLDVLGAHTVHLAMSNGATLDLADVNADVDVDSGVAALSLGGGGDWTAQGNSGADVINGGDGHNVITGDIAGIDLTVNGSNDIIHGGGGADELVGDTLQKLAGSAHGGDDLLYGDAGDDELVGDSGDVTGSAVGGNDRLFGGDGNDRLFGEFGNNFSAPTSHTGQNILDGGDGNDTLFGGTNADDVNVEFDPVGRDQFVFDTPLGSDNVDTLTFFNTHNDVIVLSAQIFSAITPVNGNLPDTAYWADNDPVATENASSRILLDVNDGKLYYDIDGSGTNNGNVAPVLFAIFDQAVGGLNGLTAADFHFGVVG